MNEDKHFGSSAIFVDPAKFGSEPYVEPAPPAPPNRWKRRAIAALSRKKKAAAKKRR